MSFASSAQAEAAAIQGIDGGPATYLDPRQVYSLGRSHQVDIAASEGPVQQVQAVVLHDARGWIAVDCTGTGLLVDGQAGAILPLKSGSELTLSDGERWVFSVAALPAGSSQLHLPRPARAAVRSARYPALDDWHCVGDGPAALSLRDHVDRLADAPTAVLVLGEVGVGKYHFARALHVAGARRQRPLILVDAVRVTRDDIERILAPQLVPPDGHPESEVAGTVILDQLQNLSGDAQKALLELLSRVSEQRRQGRFGEFPPRFVSLLTTQRNHISWPAELSAELMGMLSVMQVLIEPLRARREDIPLLAEYFQQTSSFAGRGLPAAVPREKLAVLDAYDWPGNLAELRQEVDRALLLHAAGAEASFEWQFRTQAGAPSVWREKSLEEVEREHIATTLAVLNWRKSRAAQVLGIERSTLDRKIRRYGLTRPQRPQQ